MIRENLSNFFNHWQLDKDKATDILGENKKYNADLKAGKIPGKSHPKDKKTYSLYNLSSAKVISKRTSRAFS